MRMTEYTDIRCPDGCVVHLRVRRDRWGHRDGLYCPNCLGEWTEYEARQ